MPAPLLRLRGISKSFEGVNALHDIDLDIVPGTIHAFVGENGAGKSTLGKILAGVHAPDAGTLEVDDQQVSFGSPREAIGSSITIVAQELALVTSRSVIENIFLGAEAHVGPFVRNRALKARFLELTMSTGIEVSPNRLVGELTIAEQQKVEILRAIARDVDVIVMDEPTARLATHEAEALMAILARLRDAGTTIVFVSHFLTEVLAVSDRITVLRDGGIVDDRDAADFDHASLIAAMVGRPLDTIFPQKPSLADVSATALRVTGLTRKDEFADISFDVRAGEIVVITGLVGSGRSELIRTIYGLARATSGSVDLFGRPAGKLRPDEAIARGLSLIPESRKTEGLVLSFPLVTNVALPHLGRFSTFGFLHARKLARQASKAMTDVGVRAASSRMDAGMLSGGNQQKLLFARAFMGDLRLLIADEPTRGVDIAAKSQIYDLIVEQARRGTAVLIVSSEMEEVIGLAHRVLVMRQGRMLGELIGSEISDNRIASLAFGHTSAQMKDTEK